MTNLTRVCLLRLYHLLNVRLPTSVKNPTPRPKTVLVFEQLKVQCPVNNAKRLL